MCLLRFSTKFVDSSCPPCFIVGVDAKIVNLVTPIRQPIHGPHPQFIIIGRSSTSSTGFYFIPSILDKAGRNPFSNIPSDDGYSAVREIIIPVSSIFI
jgi:hypothetical protein